MLWLVEAKGAAGVAEDMVPKPRRDDEAVAAGGCRRGRSLILANSADGIAGAVRAMMTRPDSASLPRQFSCPTLILVGEEDGITPPPLRRGDAARHRRIAAGGLPGGGDLPNSKPRTRSTPRSPSF
jgi:pimeloyl-ACP methyl ester carboxylesterase